MIGARDMKLLWSSLIALTACNPVVARSESAPSGSAEVDIVHQRSGGSGSGSSAGSGRTVPARYLKAFMCEFDENPVAAADRLRKTPGGRAERAGDLMQLRSLGFAREASNYGLESVGGIITAPPGVRIFGLPVQSLEINGMLGDVNASYVTTFAQGITAAQVGKAARLTMDRARFNKYKMRYYTRRIGNSPNMELSLSDRGGSNAQLTCRVQVTPD